jgi:hypothetical protein
MVYGPWSSHQFFITAIISCNENLPGFSQQDTSIAPAPATDNGHYHSMGTGTRKGMFSEYFFILLHIASLLFFSFRKTKVQVCHHQWYYHQYAFCFCRRIDDQVQRHQAKQELVWKS